MRYRPFTAAAALLMAQAAPLPAGAQQTQGAATVEVDSNLCASYANLSLVRQGDNAPQIGWNCVGQTAIALPQTGVSAVISRAPTEGVVRMVQAAVPNGDDGACLAMRMLLNPVQTQQGPRIPYTNIVYAYVPKAQLMADAEVMRPTDVNFVTSVRDLPEQASACSGNLSAVIDALTPIAAASVRAPQPAPPVRSAPARSVQRQDI